MGTISVSLTRVDHRASGDGGDNTMSKTQYLVDDNVNIENASITANVAAVTSSTGTESSVAGNASAVQLLASNTSRKGAIVTNESSAVLYLLLGSGTPSSTNHTVALAGNSGAPYAYYEVPAGFQGAIQGIWASATGAAKITELT